MKNESRFGRVVTVIGIVSLLYIGHGLHRQSGSFLPALLPAASAGVGVADDTAETLYTSSADGKKIYMWQAFSAKPPKYLGEAEAVLSQ